MRGYDRPGWVKDAIFYQVFPDRFSRSNRLDKPSNLEPWSSPPTVHGYKGGDLLGVAERLEWLTDLGVNTIFLNPIFRSASNHRYHTHDYYAVDPLLGGEEAFQEMLDACHARGIRVVLDGVFNHASRGFFQFHDLLESGPRSPWVDWFIIRGWPLRAYDPDRPPNYVAWWNLHALPKFNTDNPKVREFLVRVGEHWVERGIDGWRLDVPNEITTPGFWEEFRQRIKARRPEAYLVGEIWGDAKEWIADSGRFDGVMNYPFAGATLAFAAGERADPKMVKGVDYRPLPPLDAAGYADFLEALLSRYGERAQQANLNLLGSHDTARVLSVAGDDRDSVILGALLLFTFVGSPCIYYGDEIGLGGALPPDCRGAFPWDRPDSWDRTILRAYGSLGALRKAHPALRAGSYRRLWPDAKESGRMLYAFLREVPEERLLIAVNAGTHSEVASWPTAALGSTGFTLLWGKGAVTPGREATRVEMPPRTGAVWKAQVEGKPQSP